MNAISILIFQEYLCQKTSSSSLLFSLPVFVGFFFSLKLHDYIFIVFIFRKYKADSGHQCLKAGSKRISFVLLLSLTRFPHLKLKKTSHTFFS